MSATSTLHARSNDPPNDPDYLDDWRAALAAEREMIERELDLANIRFWFLHLSGLCR